MDKISVIIPCHNSERNLHRCLDSVLAQTYKDFEVIVIDDGSTDSTLDLLRDYAVADNRIIYMRIRKCNPSAARNFGLKVASGNYIQFIDSDDDIEPTMFEHMLRTSKRTNADVVACRFKHDCFKQFLPAGTYHLKNKAECLKYYSDFFTYNVPWNKLYKREVITEFFDESVRVYEDGLFSLANFKNINKVVVIEDVFYNYFNAGADESASVVNAFLNTKFWETKEGYWFKFCALNNKFLRSLSTLFSDIEDFAYVRTFDMAFWELAKLIHAGLPEDLCALEMNAIFVDEEFKKSARFYGYKLEGLSQEKVKGFVKSCYKRYDYAACSKQQKEPFYEYLDLFNTFFKDSQESYGLNYALA